MSGGSPIAASTVRRSLRGVLCSIALATALLPSVVFASEALELTGADAVQQAVELNGQRVRIEGEALGDILRTGDGHAWINVLSGGTALGIWMKQESAEKIGSLGDYQMRGDLIVVEGTLNAACPQHGGDLDVHADQVSVIADGEPVARPFHWWKLGLAAALGLVATVQALLYRRRRRAV